MKFQLFALLLLTAGCAAETDDTFVPDDTVEVEVVDTELLSLTFSSAASKLGVTLRYQQVPGTQLIEAMTEPYIYKTGSSQPLVSLRFNEASFAYHDLCNRMSGKVWTNFDAFPTKKTLNLTNYVVVP